MKIRKFFVLLACLGTASAHAAVDSIHITVLCPATRPSVAASFEQTASAKRPAQSCEFLNLIGNPSAAQAADWQAKLTAVQGLSLTSRQGVPTASGLQINLVDAQGRVRSVKWQASDGAVSEQAWFDEGGLILRLDRWTNRTVVSDTNQTWTCPALIQRNVGIAAFYGLTRTGDVATEVGELEDLGNIVVGNTLTTKLGLPVTAYSPSPADLVAVATVVPTVAPTAVPVPVPTLAPTKVPTAVPTAIPVPAATLAPTLVPTQGQAPKSRVAPQAKPTVVPGHQS